MGRQQAFKVASWVALVAWVGTAASALVIATFGIIGLTGAGDYRYRLDLDLPGETLHLGYQPSWGVQQYGEVCEKLDVRSPEPGCHSLVFKYRGEGEDLLDEEGAAGVYTHGPVKPTEVHLDGHVLFDPEPGWDPLIASLYGMQVLGLLVLAFVLAQLWLLLRLASRGEAFTDQMVRRLRVMGGVLVAWELAEPVLWLFLSPKAHDYSWISFNWPSLSPADMEPGGPSWTVIAFGLLLVLLAELFRHGSDLAEEQKLTV